MGISKLKLNIVANYCGSAWTGLMQLIFIPYYVGYMGIESYGLVGVFISLQSLFGLLDFGLRTTLNREMARNTAGESDGADVRSLVRTLEIVYWLVAGVMLTAIWLLAGPISQHWVKSQTLSSGEVRQAIVLMGLALAIKWPASLYLGGLLGQQRQVLVNVITSLCETLRGFGTVVVLAFVSRSIVGFLVCHGAVAALETLLTGYFLWKSLPAGGVGTTFRTDLFLERWRFSAGVFGITITATILMQADKIILSRALTLEMFGYYTLAWSVAGALLRAVSPVQAAVFPKFSELVARQAYDGIVRLYHVSSQLVALILIPAAVVLFFFSNEVLRLWLGDPITANKVAPMVAVLAAATALYGLRYIPDVMQLAYGWTSLTLAANIVSVAVIIPGIILANDRFGVVGAATVWIAIHGGYILIAIRLMHKRILKTELSSWYFHDVLQPLLAVLLIVIPCWILLPRDMSPLSNLVAVVAVWCAGLAACLLATARIRGSILAIVSRYRFVSSGAEVSK